MQLSIPMPGHALTPAEETDALASAAELESLVIDHDVVFLLTDTRESRWLPTALAAKHRCLAITAALAFDSFVVLRHGVPPPAPQPRDTTAAAMSDGQHPDTAAAATLVAPAATLVTPAASIDVPASKQPAPQPRLGCYFCNDVVAPQDSTLHRSLDQQCTVTRPGLAFLAAAVAGELCVNVVQHPQGGAAPHLDVQAAGDGGLGAVPHMIRCVFSNRAGKVGSLSLIVCDDTGVWAVVLFPCSVEQPWWCLFVRVAGFQ